METFGNNKKEYHKNIDDNKENVNIIVNESIV